MRQTLGLVIVLGLAAHAHAQTPPDVVRLANGGMLRGTLVENVPGDHVTIQLATGETRTVPAAQVVGVDIGGLAGSPSAPTLPANAVEARSAQPPTTRLRVLADRGGMSLYALAGSVLVGDGAALTRQSEQFRLLCAAPCEMEVQRGEYVFGVGRGTNAPRAVSTAPVSIAGASSVRIQYQDRTVFRVAGWVTAIVGSILVAPFSYLAIADTLCPPPHSCTYEPSIGWIVAAALSGIIALAVGLPLIFLGDQASVAAT